MRADMTQFSDYFFRCHGNGLRGTPRKRWASFSASGEKLVRSTFAPGKPGTTRGDEFATKPLSWFGSNRPPSACSTSQCCHPSGFETLLAVGSVSVCLKIQRILSKQKQRLLLPLLESPRSGTGNRPASLLDYSSFVIVPILDTPIFHDTIIYFLSKNIPEIQKTGTMSLLNDLQGFRSRFFKE